MIGFTSCKKTSTTPNNSTSTNSNKLSDEYLILNDGLKTDTFNNVFFNLKESSTLGKYVHYSFENNQTKNVTLDSIVKSDLKLPEITITLPHDLSQLSVGVKSLLNTIYEASYFDNSKMYTLDIDETGSLCLHNYDFFRVRKNDGSPTYPNNTSNKNYSYYISHYNDEDLKSNKILYKNTITSVGPVQKIENDYSYNSYYIIEGEFITKTMNWEKTSISKTYNGKYRLKIKYKI